MATVKERIAALQPGQKFISFEFFPPKTDAGFRNLLSRLNRMLALNPLFITVTWGAGGSTSEKSLDLASTCQNHLGLTTVLHLTCTNTNREIIDQALAKAKQAGIRNILALRGDPPRTQEYWTPNCDFNSAVDLVRYIKSHYGDYFCIGVAGYPEGHVDGSGSGQPEQSPTRDIPYLIEKVEAGADYIISQLFFDGAKFLQYEQLLRSYPQLKDITLIPGLMPITTYLVFQRASKLSHASIPKAVEDRLKSSIHNDDLIKSIGIDIVTELIDEIDSKTDGRIQGYHFYCLNLEKAVASILQKSSILRPIMEAPSSGMNLEDAIASDDEENDIAVIQGPKRRQSSIVNDNEVVNAQRSLVSKALLNDKKLLVDISRGKGALGKDATWDEFTNGRYGDSTSPAYGDFDAYGPNLKISSPQEAIRNWGSPTSKKDLSKIFVNYLLGKIDVLPWVDTGLSSETALIQEELLQLNERGWFSLSSQPSVNGCPSSDKIFGWGPTNGFVYQKSFIEIFIPKEEWETKLLPKLANHIEEKTITYYLGDATGNIESNLRIDPANPHISRSAITWGVFPLKEVLQPTVIDFDSFKVWNEEAFNLWLDWSKCFKKDEESFKFLSDIRQNYYLVSIVYHNFKQETGLWDLLLNE
ncbi:methylenetetrahydrofolate reduct [Suhomyces tanzawaensis NRRL Y-17324]|uniref:Methylenetetrahydrofolate reduct n=1 Tax=Suhomyces tanzawaensis NRRL Y-17324 TaxID=984487 RepID=A0A1E4SSH2_9ASCO|nr:methylenetetrahydrofolate reduct [Suhomyces tanzawaensis NRRL Y-17324]ODV82451.1 methylenetetrahydrofolate reduct [Suhomyces tanzawaensis NRRL Y-17324]